MILDSLHRDLDELQDKHPEYTTLVADAEFILRWFKILAKDIRRSCDKQCSQLICDPQEFIHCNYYDPGYNRCILELLLSEEFQNR